MLWRVRESLSPVLPLHRQKTSAWHQVLLDPRCGSCVALQQKAILSDLLVDGAYHSSGHVELFLHHIREEPQEVEIPYASETHSLEMVLL